MNTPPKVKKLYMVDVEFSYYVIAPDTLVAMSYASDAADDIHPIEHAWAREVRRIDAGHEKSIAPGFTRESRVYGADDELTLGEALDALAEPEKQEVVG